MSPDASKFVTFSFDDRQIRIFNFYTGKLLKTYDESLEVVEKMHHNQQERVIALQQTEEDAAENGKKKWALDDMDFGRRLAVEREIGKAKGGQSPTANAGNHA